MGWFSSTLDTSETLTLLYYAGYLAMTSVLRFSAMLISVLICVKAKGDRFKIPNQEVMDDWAQWIVKTVGGNSGSYKDIAVECAKGPVNIFQ